MILNHVNTFRDKDTLHLMTVLLSAVIPKEH
jgi:hypothetical protein